jgi:hypothetical protein
MDDRDFIYFMNGALKFKPVDIISSQQADIMIENICEVYKHIQESGYINDFDSLRIISFIEGTLMYYDDQPYETKKRITSLIKNEIDDVMWRFERDTEEKTPFFTKDFEINSIKKQLHPLFEIEKQYNELKEESQQRKQEEEQEEEQEDGAPIPAFLKEKNDNKLNHLIDWATKTTPSKDKEKLQKVTFDIILENGGGFTVRQRTENDSIDDRPLAVFTNGEVVSAATDKEHKKESSVLDDIKKLQQMGVLKKDELLYTDTSYTDTSPWVKATLLPLEKKPKQSSFLVDVQKAFKQAEINKEDIPKLDLEIYQDDNGSFFLKQRNLGNKLDNLLPSPVSLSDYYNDSFFQKEVHKKEEYEKLQNEIIKKLAAPELLGNNPEFQNIINENMPDYKSRIANLAKKEQQRAMEANSVLKLAKEYLGFGVPLKELDQLETEMLERLKQPASNPEQIQTQKEVFQWFRKLNEKYKNEFEKENKDEDSHIFNEQQEEEVDKNSLNSITENIVEKISENV